MDPTVGPLSLCVHLQIPYQSVNNKRLGGPNSAADLWWEEKEIYSYVQHHSRDDPRSTIIPLRTDNPGTLATPVP